MLEFYAGFVTGVLLMLFWIANKPSIVSVNKDMTTAYKRETYRLVKIPEEHTR